ncbi:MAG: DUF1737 domain-containing protein [Pseudomonadota bacterium]|uniref:DUF1737 domain-containing protein n=1 Tax=Roseovarius TaxID=74030 RepID=UPI0022A81344|nr:DUF1737 domain-containing protein [Roseovarius sp. EGI FJ00037]MCZ0812443.1 DUF1737 domain-containing protein [Roseovarius sp. EGI FJ00037]
MTRITEYKVISALYAETDADETHDRLSKQVNDHIKNGWQPFGQLASATLAETLILTQPMVR